MGRVFEIIWKKGVAQGCGIFVLICLVQSRALVSPFSICCFFIEINYSFFLQRNPVRVELKPFSATWCDAMFFFV